MGTPNVSLKSTKVNQGMQDSMTASVLLQTYTNTVLQTPDVKLPAQVDTDSKSTVVEQLPKDQAAARTNASFYLSTINPLIVGTVADVIGFGNLWKAEYNRLFSLAQNITVGNNAAVFTAGINNLIKKTQAAEAETLPVIAALNAFLPKIQADDRALTTDLNNVTTAMSGEGGEIDQLKKQISAYNDAMSKDLAIIGAGSTAVVVGGLAVVCGILLEIETAGVSTALVVGGLAVAAGGVVAVGIAAADYSKVTKEYASATAELDKDKQLLSTVQQGKATVASLVDAVGKGITAVLGLQKGWNSLKDDFDQVVQQLDEATPDLGTWLTDTLAAANADWQVTLTLAEQLQSFGTLSVSTKKMAA